MFVQSTLDENIFQYKEYRQNTHSRRKFLEIATDEVDQEIRYHTQQNAIRNRVCHWHHNDANKSRD